MQGRVGRMVGCHSPIYQAGAELDQSYGCTSPPLSTSHNKSRVFFSTTLHLDLPIEQDIRI